MNVQPSKKQGLPVWQVYVGDYDDDPSEVFELRACDSEDAVYRTAELLGFSLAELDEPDFCHKPYSSQLTLPDGRELTSEPWGERGRSGTGA